MTKTLFLRYYRILFGLLGLSAVITEVVALIGYGSFTPQNFFSYFTIESNILAAVFFIVYGWSTSSKNEHRLTIQLIRGAIVLYMLMTGIIFAVLLAGIEGATLTAVPWDNIVLHYIMPIVVVADWFAAPSKVRISLKQSWVWLLFPLAYVFYSLVRGSIVHWYPYPFLDPTIGGYTTVITTALVLALGVVIASWALRLITRTPTLTRPRK